MDIFVNDFSIHSQFHDTFSFQAAMDRLMEMRQIARSFEREIYCHRALRSTMPMPSVSMQQAVGRLPDDSKRRAIMIWLTKEGPFWEDFRQHGVGDWLECKNEGTYSGEIVTDSAVGEAGFRNLHGVETSLVTVVPSNWNFSPVMVAWVLGEEDQGSEITEVDNWLVADELKAKLQSMETAIRSWNRVREAASNRFSRLKFANDCFDPLDGVPFAKSSADRILCLLDILNQLAHSVDETGERTAEGHKLYQNFFHGDTAWFSDSSKSEKIKFRRELTFDHPDDPATQLLCTWHGKEHHSILRIHYSWSGTIDDPVYVVYVGPKITKQ